MPRRTRRLGKRLFVGIIGLGSALMFSAEPRVTAPEVEGSFHGFPVLRDLGGRRLADGEFTQWIDGEQLRVRNTYDFGDGHRVEERVAFQREPLAQQEWSWREMVGASLLREYAADLRTGEAWAEKREGGETKRWREHLKVEPGRTFAGVGFTVALRHLRDRLVAGQTIELRAIGFTPKPRLITVRIFHDGIDRMLMAGRRVSGDRFIIQPKIPAVVKLIVEAPDTRIWLTHPWPAGFLRWEGAFAEPSDPIMRVDLLPGEPSGPAEPVSPEQRPPRDR